ncbi:270_t:CDS:2, partial [Acaulospora colombiana]
RFPKLGKLSDSDISVALDSTTTIRSSSGNTIDGLHLSNSAIIVDIEDSALGVTEQTIAASDAVNAKEVCDGREGCEGCEGEGSCSL